MWFDDPIEKEIRRLSNRFFNWDDDFETRWFGGNSLTYGPYYYGYSMTVDENGKPVVKEYGNFKPGFSPASSSVKQPYVDKVVDQENNTLKLVAEIPGVEKSDINVVIDGNTVSIQAEHDERKYNTVVPINHKIDENNVKAKYTNGVLEITLRLAEEKPKGKLVTVQ